MRSKMQNLRKLPTNWILTPHEGELSRLLGVSSTKNKANRKKYTFAAQKIFGCIILRKGFRILVANSKGIWEMKSGNSSLAKAGAGFLMETIT